MTHPMKTTSICNENGTYEKYAFPGGYQINYYTADGGTLCSKCVNNEEEVHEGDRDDPQWQITSQGIHWEGEPEYCDHCNKVLHSEYGDPEDRLNP